MSTTVHINAQLHWKYGRTKSGNFIAVCDPIAQTVQADSFNDLVDTIQEVVSGTFKELFSTGDLEKFLHDRGWSMKGLPEQPKPRNLRFDVPFTFNRMGRRELELVG